MADKGIEAGFFATPDGRVGNGWHWSCRGGPAGYGFCDDTWAPMVGGQLARLNSTHSRWSPDGACLAYVADGDDSPAALVSLADGSGAHPVREGPAMHWAPAASSDGFCGL